MEEKLSSVLQDYKYVCCNADKNHLSETMDCICLDERCRAQNKFFHPLCSFCILDDTHQQKDHKYNSIKRSLAPIVQYIENPNFDNVKQEQNIMDNLRQSQKNLKVITQICAQLDQNLEQKIQKLILRKESMVKNVSLIVNNVLKSDNVNLISNLTMLRDTCVLTENNQIQMNEKYEEIQEMLEPSNKVNFQSQTLLEEIVDLQRFMDQKVDASQQKEEKISTPEENPKQSENIKAEPAQIPEPVKAENVEPVKAEPAKQPEPAKAAPPKKAEPAKKPEPAKAEPPKKAEPVKAEPAKKPEPAKVEPPKKVEPVKAEPAKKPEPAKVEPPKKAEPVKAEPAKKPEPAKAEPPKQAEPVKAEPPKK